MNAYSKGTVTAFKRKFISVINQALLLSYERKCVKEWLSNFDLGKN